VHRLTILLIVRRAFLTHILTRSFRVALVVLLACGIGAAASGQSVPVGFVDEAIVGGLDLPTAFTTLPDGRLLVAEKAGTVRVINNGQLLATPFIDLRSSVNDYWDRGLLGIAADRNFSTNGFVYLFYVYENDPIDYSGPKTGRLIRVTASGDVASPASAVTILGTTVGRTCNDFPAGTDCIPTDSPSHAVGNVKAAPDGTLFVTIGEGADFTIVDDNALRSQSLNSLGGKMLHITTAGKGLPGNPFWNGNLNANQSKILAYGLRNPYRFALDPVSGVPYLGDVGWNLFEEINAVNPAGNVNFGWPCYEGPGRTWGYDVKPACQALYALEPNGAQPPTVYYLHRGEGAAATGGVFYSGSAFPSQYQRTFFYTDYSIGFIRYFHVDSAGGRSGALAGFAAGLRAPVYLDTDGQNLLYVSIVTGEIRRIRYTGSNPNVSYLSDKPWTAMSNGFGPVERDQSNGDADVEDGGVLTLNDVPYAKGLGVFAPSDVRFALNGLCSAFAASVGVDRVGFGGVVFQAFADGVKVFDSGLMTPSSTPQTVNASISGKNELRLVVTDGGDGTSGDYANWADARLTCAAAPDPAPPVVTTVNPVAGSTGVVTATDVTATFSKAMAASTLTAGTFTLVPQGSTTPVAATVTYAAATNTVTLDPTAGLAGTTVYTATIKGGASGATDTSGIPLATDKVWTFTTTAVDTTAPTVTTTSPVAGAASVSPAANASATFSEAMNPATLTNSSVTLVPQGSATPVTATVTYAASTNTVTLDPTATLAVSKVHTATIKGGASGAKDVTGNALASDKVWTFTTGAPPTPTISQPLGTFRFKVGDVINYSGSATDPEDGTVPAGSLSWRIVLFHCPGGTCHQHPFTTGSGTTGTFTAPDHGDDSYFVITLTATDTAGLTGTTSVTIQPQTVQLTLNTSPTGLQVVYGGLSATAPATFTTTVGSTHTIYAPSPQGSLTFTGWSDGAAQQHNVVVGSTNVTFVASFGSAPPAPPVAAYSFNEGAGSTAHDTSANNNTGTISNPSWAAGKTGSSLAFNGANTAVSIPDTNGSLDVGALTLEMWIYKTGVTSDYNAIAGRQTGTSWFDSWILFYDNVESADAYRFCALGCVTGPSSTGDLNTWVHIAATEDGTTTRLYRNGVLVASSAPHAGTLAVETTPVCLGAGANDASLACNSEFVRARLDDVRIYGRALTATEIQSDMATPVGGGSDTTAPTVNIQQPANGATVSGNSVAVTANASDNVGVAGVQFKLDGANLGAEDTTAPYSVTWNTTTVSNGSHALTAVARDTTGNTTTSTSVTVTVNNTDTTPPTVQVTAPANGATVSGTVQLTATASDNVAIVGVQFKQGSTNVGAEDTTAPYSVSWNTTALANGSYSLTAVARDQAGNTTTSGVITVTVSNGDTTPPIVSITAPANLALVQGTITVSAAASDNVGVAGVQFKVDGTNIGAEDATAPYSVSWNTTTLPNGSHALTAVARDAAGNTTTSTTVSVTINNPDTTAPSVSITAPASGATVSGTAMVSANASDNVAVVGVQFKADGANIGSEDTSAPYSVSWNTAAVSNGSHLLTAVARDAAGNTTTSGTVSVNVANPTLVAAYNFDQGSGTTLTDSSGLGNHGSLAGPTWSAEGRTGGALSFDGSNDLVTIADANSLDLSNALTLEAWVRPTNVTGWKTVLTKESGTSSFAYSMFANNNAGNVANQRPGARLTIGGNARTVTGNAKLALNTWTHIATTYDGATIRLFINGVQVETEARTGSVSVTAEQLRIGGSPALGGLYYAGLIDDVRIYNGALSEAQIQNDMNAPVGAAPSPAPDPAGEPSAVISMAGASRPLVRDRRP
jgi:glucose/arabinose dehydrogenase